MARVVFSRSARGHIGDLDVRVAEAVLDAVTILEAEPEAGKRLRGRFEGLWSLRIGAYRLVYQVRDGGKIVRVVAVLHRRIAYRSTRAEFGQSRGVYSVLGSRRRETELMQ